MRFFDVSGRFPINIAFLPSRNENFLGKTGVVSGFGIDNVKNITQNNTTKKITLQGSSSGKLRYGFVKILQPSECEADLFPTYYCGRMEKKFGFMPKGICSVCKHEFFFLI